LLTMWLNIAILYSLR